MMDSLYNNTDLMGTGFGLSGAYAITPKLNLTVGYQTHTIRVEGSIGDAEMAKTMVMVTYAL